MLFASPDPHLALVRNVDTMIGSPGATLDPAMIFGMEGTEPRSRTTEELPYPAGQSTPDFSGRHK